MSQITGSESVDLFELPVPLVMAGTALDLFVMSVLLSELAQGHREWVGLFLVPTVAGVLSGLYLLLTRTPSQLEGPKLRPLATFVFLFVNVGLLSWIIGAGKARMQNAGRSKVVWSTGPALTSFELVHFSSRRLRAAWQQRGRLG